MKKRIKVSYVVAAFIMIIQFLVLAVFFVFTKYELTSNIRQNTVDNMQIIVTDRSTLIENYVKETEAYLTAYSRADDIINLLKNPNDVAAQAKAQRFTETFSADKEHLEGIYASEWNTHMLTHTNAEVVGITTREGDSLTALHDAMLAADGVYNTGIIISPTSNQQIISMYRAVLDENNNPIGLVGAGIFTTGIKQHLENLPINGMESAKYYLLNTNSSEYIFHDSEDMIGTVTEDPYILSIIEASKTKETGFVESDNGDITAYHAMKDRGWVFVLGNTAEEIFAATNKAENIFLLLCICAIILLTLVTFFIISIALRPLSPIGNLLMRMANYDIKKDEVVEKYIKRKDDLGDIAVASLTLQNSLSGIVQTLKECTEQVETKSSSLHDTSIKLVDSVTENIAVTEELSASLEGVNNATDNVNMEIGSIKKSIEATVDSINGSNKSSDEMLENAKQMKQDAENAFQNSKERLDQAKITAGEALESLQTLKQINELAKQILNITDQTNLLSLNASIEAARAGDAGKGFAIVASEIKTLADTSGQTAASIQKLCETSNVSIASIQKCIEDIMSFVEKDVLDSFGTFSERSNAYSNSVNEIKNDIESVTGFVSELKKSIEEITENITNVTSATRENNEAIGVVVVNDEQIGLIAEQTKLQSEENQVIARQLEEISHKFSV